MFGRTTRRQNSLKLPTEIDRLQSPSPRPGAPASQRSRQIKPYVLGALALATVLLFAWVIDYAASSAAARNGSFPQQGLPRVALMFLSRGALPYEPVWREFLEGIPDKHQEATGKQGKLLAPWEAAFSLFVHVPGRFRFPKDSLFSGHETKQRVAVEWGQWTVMAAERILLAAALAGDPWAARFVLLSESCIPLYPASVVWMQLISQPLSRIDACMRPEDPEDYNKRMGYRMHADMVTGDLMADHWRKSSQWFALTREHVDWIVQDTQIRDIFAKECWVDKENLEKGWSMWRFCVSDEHYVPTLLAVLGLDSQTDCKGSVTSAWWDGPYFHPKTWQSEEMDPHLVTMLRGADNGQCPSSEAVRTADMALQGVLRSSAPGSILQGDRLWGPPSRRKGQYRTAGTTDDDDEESRNRRRQLLGVRGSMSSSSRPSSKARRLLSLPGGVAGPTTHLPEIDGVGIHPPVSGNPLVSAATLAPFQGSSASLGLNPGARLQEIRDVAPAAVSLRRLLEQPSPADLDGPLGALQDAVNAYQAMGYDCPLFARKFGAEAAPAVEAVLGDILQAPQDVFSPVSS
ncbi:hypothetical protein WJX84_010563 [Apatococcus fuscideae]|uniref:Uncharacterized protein n=1 Tax=Apatococcus fuscideae TaxID=2026836 RepID=A0AAW1T788_9CHLO